MPIDHRSNTLAEVKSLRSAGISRAGAAMATTQVRKARLERIKSELAPDAGLPNILRSSALAEVFLLPITPP
jgi:hypothetical protein